MDKIPTTWKQKKFGDVVNYFTSGDPFLKLQYASSGIPVLSKGDVKPFGRIEQSEKRFITNDLAKIENFRFTQPGDYLLTTRDLTQAAEFLGLLAPIDSSKRYLINQGANVVRFSDDVNGRFVTYWCNGPVYRNYIKGFHVGSTQIHIRKEDFLNAPLYLPPLSEQKAIAHVLGALDDKIELNRRMNATLEAMARALFQSWFVDFDPVRAKLDGRAPAGMDAETAALFPAAFQDSPLGPIPEGWAVSTLGEVAKPVGNPIASHNLSRYEHYIGLEHMPRKSIALYEWGTSQDIGSNKTSFRKGDILFGKLRPYFHKVAVAPIDGLCSTDILVINAVQPMWFGFALAHLSSAELISYTEMRSDGTRMPRTSWHELAHYAIVVPMQPIAKLFDEQIQAIVSKIQACIFESRTLAALRDTLLPKLLSGEVRIPDAESIIGNAL